MAGRLVTLRLLRLSLHSSPQSSAPSLSILHSLLAARFFSSRRTAVSKEKSLIDDEAELSDWIGDLKTDSVRFRLSSDSEDDENTRINTRHSRGSAQKRGVYSDSDEDVSNGRFGSGRERGGGRGGRDKGFSGGRDKGFSGGRDKGFSCGRDRGRKESSFDLSDQERGFRSQGRAQMSGAQRGGRGNKSFSGRREMNGRDSQFDFSDEQRGFRDRGGACVSEAQRGVRKARGERESSFGFSNEERGIKTQRTLHNSKLSEQEEEEDESDGGFSDSEEFLKESLDLEKDGKVVKSSNEGENHSYLSQKRFDECSLSQLTLKGLKSAGYERMTVVQEATLPVILQGKDVLAKARTGTGKTVAFLLPAIEIVTKLPPVDRDDRRPPFNVLIICPTRELADQAAQEAAKLLKHHASISVQLVIGGTRLALEQKRMQTNPSQSQSGAADDELRGYRGVVFQLPAIEMVAKLPPVDREDKRPPFNVLIICPTRELADQASQEAMKLLKHHASISVQLVIGGTRLALEQKRMQTNPSQILVGTPGRLKDHTENTPGFAARLKGVKCLVLDEADRLLDMGFRPDIERIVESVPKQRQTLLFSATVPDEVKHMCYIALKRDFEFINTVEEGSEETHAQVKQMHIVAPLENQFGILYGLLTDHISENIDYKVIVFCTTAMVTRLVSEYLAELKLNVREIHSRKPQSYRTRVSKEFKEAKGLILVSSDVSARGVDYPNVTLVVQIGVPADREQYIHRLGRTGRKGKEGTGILILAPWENYFLRNIKDLPISESPLPLIDPDTRKKVERALAHVDEKDKEKAYQAWLGYYNSNKNVGRDKYQLVSLANEFSRSIGMDNPPALPKLILRKMGLNNIPGLRTR